MSETTTYSKPIVFLSHSSQDKQQLLRLKQLITDKTGGAIDLFLSSDGQSIRLGTNWVAELENALTRCKLMFAFVTPASLRSGWLYFECGHARARGIRVIPIGLGIDLDHQRPPLSLLQGFNLTSHDTLNNLLTVINEEFHHKHALTCVSSDFGTLVEASLGESGLGRYAGIIDYISITIDSSLIDKCHFENTIAMITDTMRVANTHIEEGKSELGAPGLSFKAIIAPTKKTLRVSVDPSAAEPGLSLLNKVIHALRTDGWKGVESVIVFEHGIKYLHERFRVTARIQGTPIRVADSGRLQYKDVVFSFGSTQVMTVHGLKDEANNLHVIPTTDSITLATLVELLDASFECGLLMYVNDN